MIGGAFTTGQLTVGATRVKINTRFPDTPYSGLLIKADASNSSKIVIGDQSVTFDSGFVLTAGEGVHLPTQADVYAISDDADQKITWVEL